MQPRLKMSHLSGSIAGGGLEGGEGGGAARLNVWTFARENMGVDGEVGEDGSIGNGSIGGGCRGGGRDLVDLDDDDLGALDDLGIRGVMVAKEKVGDFSGVLGVCGGAAVLGLRMLGMLRLELLNGFDADRKLVDEADCSGQGRSGAA